MAGQKRSADEAESLLIGVKSIVFDIEGTTTPISFVKDTLFPYVRKNVADFLTKKFDDADVQKAVSSLRELAKKESAEKLEGCVEIPSEDASKEDVVKAVESNILWQMDGDRKTTELKELQGLVWKDAYESKEVKGQLFEDVGPMLRMLAEEGLTLYVYSSGSIQSQKLLFSNSTVGDLSDVFSGFFDTTTGSKRETESYKKIAKEIGKEPKDILFLTDIPEEAEAAVGAGFRSALVIRPGNADLTDDNLQNFACIERFDELYGEEDDEDDVKRFAGDEELDDSGEDDEDEEDDDEVDEDDEDLDGEVTGEEDEEDESEDV